MSAWVINQYGTNEVLKYSEEIPVPSVRSPSDVMIKVHAASLNPIDTSMRGKCWQTQFESNLTREVFNTPARFLLFQEVMGLNC